MHTGIGRGIFCLSFSLIQSLTPQVSAMWIALIKNIHVRKEVKYQPCLVLYLINYTL